MGLKPRAVQLILRALEAAGAIRCVPDDSLVVQRRIVLLGHPGSLASLSRKGGAIPCAGGAKEDMGGAEEDAQACKPLRVVGAQPDAPESQKTKPKREPQDSVGPVGENRPPESCSEAEVERIMRRFFPGAKKEG